MGAIDSVRERSRTFAGKPRETDDNFLAKRTWGCLRGVQSWLVCVYARQPTHERCVAQPTKRDEELAESSPSSKVW